MANDDTGRGPCSGGLTANCFKQLPAFARRAFAYRLLHTMIPKPLARKLPEILSRALIGDGAHVPPGWNLPPGTVVPPGTILPAPGVETPGDIPSGDQQDAAPGAPGAQPTQPTPVGALAPPSVGLPPSAYGAVPPLYVPPWTPGPVDVPGKLSGGGGASAAQITVYSTSDDGFIEYGNPSWATTRGQIQGTSIDNTIWGGLAARAAFYVPNYSIYRSFYYFDLSAVIPAGATITAVTFRLAGYTFSGHTACVQEGTQSTPLVLGDYDEFTGNSFANIVWQADTYPAVKYNDFVLDAAGIAYIQSVIAGTALLCCREYTHDYLNSAPVTQPIQCNTLYSEVGDGNAPNLIIDYTS